MYELIRMTENDYYVDCPAKIGLVRVSGDEVVLIDSGSDKDAGKKVLRILEAQGWKLRAIFNTHSHADHIGGNRFLQERTGCEIYAPGIEAAYTNDPILEPVGLYGGLPMEGLRHKFLMAQASTARELTESALPAGMKLLPLPGHSPDMVGFLTEEGTAYLADCVSSEETLGKYGIGYMWDPETARKTMESVKTLGAARYVPSHAPVTEDIAALADKNIAAVDGVFGTILSLCGEAITFEKLLKKVFDAYNLQASVQQYALIGSTLRAYLTDLLERGSVTFDFAENEMLWRRA